jgi:leader peptidase (prepilin peptidase)/N-methyltransferase
VRNLIIEIILTLILTLFGYVYTVYRLSGQTFAAMTMPDFIPRGRNRKLYIAVSLLLGIVVSASLTYVYSASELLHHVKLLILVMFIVPMAAIDHVRQVIPNALVLAAIVLRFLYAGLELILNTSEALEIMKSAAIGALVIGGFFLILSFIMKNSIGMGDVKLFFVMGLYQGIWGAANAVFFSLLVSFFYAIFLLLTKRKTRKDSISLAPCVLIGTCIAIGLSGM